MAAGFVRDSRPRAPPAPCMSHSFEDYSSIQQTFVKGFPRATVLSAVRDFQGKKIGLCISLLRLP